MSYNNDNDNNNKHPRDSSDFTLNRIRTLLNEKYLSHRLGYMQYYRPYEMYRNCEQRSFGNYHSGNCNNEPTRSNRLNPSKAKCIRKASHYDDKHRSRQDKMHQYTNHYERQNERPKSSLLTI